MRATAVSPAADTAAPFWSRDADALLADLGSSRLGLSADEAAWRLRTQGPNAIDDAPAAGLWRLAARQLESPLVLILVFGSGVSMLLRQWLDASIILAIVLGSCGLGFAQERRASNAVEQLRRRLALRVRARRDGVPVTVEAAALVPDDRLAAGLGQDRPDALPRRTRWTAPFLGRSRRTARVSLDGRWWQQLLP